MNIMKKLNPIIVLKDHGREFFHVDLICIKY